MVFLCYIRVFGAFGAYGTKSAAANEGVAKPRAFGAPLDEVTLDHEVQTTETGHDVMHGRLEAGTVYAQRFTWKGVCQGESRIEIDALHLAASAGVEDGDVPQEIER